MPSLNSNSEGKAPKLAPFAHSVEGTPECEWEPLPAHLQEVANLTRKFTGVFNLGFHGYLAGLWHDLGKYSSEFQQMIRRDSQTQFESAPGKPDHSTCGAQHASKALGAYGHLLAYCIAGHHSGLANAGPEAGSLSTLCERLKKKIPLVPAKSEIVEAPAAKIMSLRAEDKDALRREIRSLEIDGPNKYQAFQFAFATRMVFSALVDADSLCTEHFYSPQQKKLRKAKGPRFEILSRRLADHIKGFAPEDTTVNRSRADVLQASREQAAEEKGFFSMTVPTGGGKTLSSLSFALDHAIYHDLRRIIFAIPFTSIIEQNATVFREALSKKGENFVLEHHSNLTPEDETYWSSKATENWDAPIIVTTNVQLFESMFGSSKSRCRKLHRLAGSIIILDEAQSLPVKVLQPCLAALRELVTNHGCTIVLCTATQPAIELREDFPIGLADIREIVKDVPALFTGLQRTKVNFVDSRSDEDLVEELVVERQALCIVNTRKHAAELFSLVKDRRTDGIFHLSALMCAEHRTEVLRKVNFALEHSMPCLLISTQVVEAGVDLDFPTVFRAMAGMDSIAQAAGRCNREGKRPIGNVYVFETDKTTSPSIKGACEDTRATIPEYMHDPLAPKAMEAYFALHYWKRSSEWDHRLVMDCFFMNQKTGAGEAFFRDAATKFRMIDSIQTSIVVPFGKGKDLIKTLRLTDQPDRQLLRKLQRFTVSVYDWQLKAMMESNIIMQPNESLEGIFVLMNNDAYDQELGLLTTGKSGFDPIIG